jgi:chromosome segregation ATPase
VWSVCLTVVASLCRSNEEKNAAVKKDLAERTAMLGKKQDYVARLEREIQEINGGVDTMAAEGGTAGTRLATAKGELEAAAAEHASLQLQRNELQNDRNTHWQVRCCGRRHTQPLHVQRFLAP